MVHDEGGPHRGLHEGQEHEPERPGMCVEVVAQRPDESEESDAPGSPHAGGTATRTLFAFIRVTHVIAFPMSPPATVTLLHCSQQGRMSQDPAGALPGANQVVPEGWGSATPTAGANCQDESCPQVGSTVAITWCSDVGTG